MTAAQPELTPDERKAFESIIDNALAEDIGKGDITSELLVPEAMQAEIHFVAHEAMVVCGLFVAEMTYAALDKDVEVTIHAFEGKAVPAEYSLVTAKGKARALLTGERVALNLLQRMCGVASLTRTYVDVVAPTKATILDTRKTMPGLRVLDKYAVRAGGGQNHRMRLDDMVLVKDNHIVLCGSIKAAIETARKGGDVPVVVECDTLEQLREAIIAKPNRVLLDNMSLEQLTEAVKLAKGVVPLEASGGVSLDTVLAIAETGVDFISVGKLTHSALAADIGADLFSDQS